MSVCWGFVCVARYDHQDQGNLHVLKEVGEAIRRLADEGGAGLLVVDDLTDTGKTAKVLREMLPRAHFGAVYAKPTGAPLIDTFVASVSQDTWIFFPWDLGLNYQPPLARGVEV